MTDLHENTSIGLPGKLEDVDTDGARSTFPEGYYLMKVDTCVEFEKEDKDNAIHVILRVNDVAGGIDRDTTISKQFHDFIPLMDSTMWRINRFCEAALGHASKGSKLKRKEYEGRTIVVKLIDGEYNGEVRSEVDDYIQAKDWARYSGSGASSSGGEVDDDAEVELGGDDEM